MDLLNTPYVNESILFVVGAVVALVIYRMPSILARNRPKTWNLRKRCVTCKQVCQNRKISGYEDDGGSYEYESDEEFDNIYEYCDQDEIDCGVVYDYFNPDEVDRGLSYPDETSIDCNCEKTCGCDYNHIQQCTCYSDCECECRQA